jgi:hypothetical protein
MDYSAFANPTLGKPITLAGVLADFEKLKAVPVLVRIVMHPDDLYDLTRFCAAMAAEHGLAPRGWNGVPVYVSPDRPRLSARFVFSDGSEKVVSIAAKARIARPEHS